MDWEGVLASREADIDADEALAGAVYAFLLDHPLSSSSELLAEPSQSAKLLSVARAVMKVKGEEAQVAFEELRARDGRVSPGGVGGAGPSSERDLLDRIIYLEKELGQRDSLLAGERERGAAAPRGEVRYLREENEDLKLELTEVKRALSHERSENERLSADSAAEKLRGRQQEREVERLQQNLEDYRKQLDWQHGSSSTRRSVEPDFRERMRRKDMEIADQLDKIEELLNARDTLERQAHELTMQLGHVEEQRLEALRDLERTRVALAESDRRGDELESRGNLLAGQVEELEEKVSAKEGAEEGVMREVVERGRLWESTLSSKQTALERSQRQVSLLEGQLKVAQSDSDRAALVRLKQMLQEREQQLVVVEQELTEATATIHSLTAQLEQARSRADPALVSPALHLEAERLRAELTREEGERRAERERREGAESQLEEKDVELTQALGRLREYERGEYGLTEAVREIKVKRTELAVRDKDIAELTRNVNSLDQLANRLSDENEAMRERLGLGPAETVDLAPLRAQRRQEMESLKRQVSQLEEEKLSLRKQRVERVLGSSKWSGSQPSLPSDTQKIQELLNEVADLGGRLEEERRQREGRERELAAMVTNSDRLRERVRAYEASLRELHVDHESGASLREPHADHGSGDSLQPKSEALERLIALLESEDAREEKGTAQQLRMQVSRLMGGASELRAQLRRKEEECATALGRAGRTEEECQNLQSELKRLRQEKSGFQPIPLPEGIAMTSHDVIGSLNEHLLRALKELKAKEGAWQEASSALERYQRKFAVVIHQQGVLYKEYSEGRQVWAEEKERMTREAEQLTALRDQDKVKVQQLEHLLKALASDPDQQRSQIGDLSRKVTVLMVNERALSRRFSLLKHSEELLRKEKAKCQREMVAMENAVTERMGYLERHKEASSFKLASLQQQLSETVPSSLLDRLNQDYADLSERHQRTLRQVTARAKTEHTVHDLRGEVQTLSSQLENVKQELALEKQRTSLLEGASATTQTHLQGSGGSGGPGGAVPDRLATLEMRELNERQRADLAMLRYRQSQDSVAQLERRNAELEEKFGGLSERLLQAQAHEAEVADKLAGCLTLADKTALESRLQTLSRSEAELKLENGKLKEVSEIARQQTVAMDTWQRSLDVETASLRRQLLEVQGGSEERAALGRLHHQVASLQASEGAGLRRLEEAEAKVLRLEAALLRCEHSRDRLSDAVFHVRAECHGKIRQLRTTVQSLRQQLVGSLPLSDQEKQAELLSRLREEKEAAETLKGKAQAEYRKAEEGLQQLQLQHQNLEELMAALRASGGEGGAAASAARLVEWHTKLGEARLREMRLGREKDQLRDQVQHLEEVVVGSERSFARLEHALVQATKDYESSQLSWEQRELELEQQVEQLRQQTSRLEGVGQGAGPESAAVQPQSLPVRSVQAQEQTNRLEQALTRAQTELLQRDREMAELRLRLAEGASGDHMTSHDTEDGVGMEERAARDARETIDRLRAEVERRGALTDKYQRLLLGSQEQLRAATQAHEAEVSALTERLRSKTDSAFSKLREAALEAASAPPPPTATEEQLSRLSELEEVCRERERTGHELSQQLRQARLQLAEAGEAGEAAMLRLRQQLQRSQEEHAASTSALEHTLAQRSSRVSELEQEVAVLEGELSAAQEAAKQAPSRSMKALVERLRKQLVVKEKQQKALSQALLQVRSDLVETAQKTLEDHDRRGVEEANVQELVERRTSELQGRVEELGSSVAAMRASLGEARAREGELRGLLQEAERRAVEKSAGLQRAEADVRSQRKAAEQAKLREQKLAHDVHELHVRLEHNPEVDELQKRVKILQGKLDKQKQHIRENEEALKAQHPVGVASGRGVTAVEASAQIDSKHSSLEVLRWEDSKRWQKRAEGLRTKLAEKARELEASHKQVTSLKEMLARADREKSLLHGKLRSAQKSAIDPALGQRLFTTPPASHTPSCGDGKLATAELEHVLRSRVFELENQVQCLERELASGAPHELEEVKRRNTRLEGIVTSLEAQLQDQRPGATDALHALAEQRERLEEELVRSHGDCMRLRLDCEQAALEVPRLKACVRDQQEYIEVLKSVVDDGNTRTTGKQGSAIGGGSGKSVSELERVVAAMRKVVERLQAENADLRRRAARLQPARQKGDVVVERGVAVMGSVNGDDKEEKIAGDIPLLPDSTPSKSPYTKIVVENERLRKDLKKEIERTERLQLRIASLEAQKSKVERELEEVLTSDPRARERHSHEEVEEALRAEVEQKTKMLHEVKRHLKEAAEREAQTKSSSASAQVPHHHTHQAVLLERDRLKQQVVELRKELDAFDPSFFEEIEDLKFNYHEAVRRNVQYEEQLAALTQSLPAPPQQHPES